MNATFTSAEFYSEARYFGLPEKICRQGGATPFLHSTCTQPNGPRTKTWRKKKAQIETNSTSKENQLLAFALYYEQCKTEDNIEALKRFFYQSEGLFAKNP
jgi:hypothetical protein